MLIKEATDDRSFMTFGIILFCFATLEGTTLLHFCQAPILLARKRTEKKPVRVVSASTVQKLNKKLSSLNLRAWCFLAHFHFC